MLAAIVPWGIGGWDSIAQFVAVFSILLALFFLWRTGEAHTSASKPLALVTTSLLGWGALSLIWSVNQYDTFKWLMVATLGVLIFHTVAQLSTEQKERLISGYVWVAAATALYGIYQYVFGANSDLIVFEPSAMATFVLPAALLNFWQIAKRGGYKNYALNTLIITFVALSKSLLILLFISVVGFVLIKNTSNSGGFWKKIVFIAGGSGALILGSILCTQLLFKNDDMDSTKRPSIPQKVDVASSAMDAWWDKPIAGSGAGTFQSTYPAYQKEPAAKGTSANNIFLQTLSELGLVGLVLLVWVTMLFLLGLARGAFSNPNARIASIGILAVLASLLVTDSYTSPAVIGLVFALAGVVYQSKERPLNLRGKLGLGLVLLVVCALSVSYFQSDSWGKKAKAAENIRDLPQAAELYAKAHAGLVYDPDSWTLEGVNYYSIATIVGGLKSYATIAEDRASEAIKRDPNDAQHYFLRGRALNMLGRNEEAIGAFSHAVHYDPYNHPEYYVDLAESYWQKGEKQVAFDVAARGTEIFNDDVLKQKTDDSVDLIYTAQLWAFRASYHLDSKEAEAATQALQKAFEIDPDNPQARKIKKDAGIKL